MNPTQQKAAAKEFVKRWQAAEGNEDREARSFWIELYQNVLGIQQPTQVLDFERRIAGRKCDVFHEDQRVLVEMKSRGVSLDESSIRSKKAGEETPYEQALWYFNHLGVLSKPYWLITCNFDELRIYDMREEIPDEGTYVSLKLGELPEKAHLLGFITDTSTSRLQVEQELSVKAAELVGKLYDGFSKQYANLETSAEEQHSLNVLIVRLVFLLYAEDAGLLQEHQAFLHYLQKFDVPQMRRALIDLFEVLDTPESERDPYMDDALAAFPYVNGGLFEGSIIIPQFTLDLRVCLLAQASAGFDWKGISPTIFGAAFESTLNPETRRAGGCHFTSVENIHKVIDPLFLDDLKAELAEIEGEKVEKTRKMRLKLFQRKLAGINILDPACGSGNFLTESYICLRHLENRVLADLLDENQLGMDLGGEAQIMVSIDQLHGIEIADFAVSVAKTALWIAESQAMDETQDILYQVFEFLPLKSVNNLHCGNALRMDWNDVLPAQECTYIASNPPFLGHISRSLAQTAELKEVWGREDIGRLDYVTGWYKKAIDYCSDTCEWAFVSTNSITQGEPVPVLFKAVLEAGWRIKFAHRTFVWNSEATDQAHVHCVIVGMTKKEGGAALYSYTKEGTPTLSVVPSINGYLTSGPNVYAEKRRLPLSTCLNPVTMGNMPRGKGLIVEPAEYAEVSTDPIACKYLRPFLMGKELINNTKRWCLWMEDFNQGDELESEVLHARLNSVRQDRLASSARSTREMAATPWLFGQRGFIPKGTYLGIPKVFSNNREWATCGFISPETIPGDKVYVCDDPDGFQFAIISSKIFILWQKTVGGRLKSDPSFSNTVVWNTLPVPQFSSEKRQHIIRAGKAVLDAREAHPGKSLADLYDPDRMPADLLAAHKTLDAAVEAAYGVDFGGDEEKIVAHLFKLYAELTAGE